MSSEAIEPGLGSKIVAAEVAASEGDYQRAEDALLSALSECRKQKATRGDSDGSS